MPEPALTRARSQVGSGEVVVCEGGWEGCCWPSRLVDGGWADSPARRRSSLHSAGVMKLSMTAAKWFLYAGIGGVVFVKSRGWMVAFGGGPSRNDGGIFGGAIAMGLRGLR